MTDEEYTHQQSQIFQQFHTAQMLSSFTSTLAQTVYVAQIRQHGNGHDTWTRGKFLKIHDTCVWHTFRTWYDSW